MSSTDTPPPDHEGPSVTTQSSQSDEERDLQEENAETSLDQPSS